MAKERNLPSKTTLTTSDYIRVVGSDNASYKQGVPSLMNTMGVARTLISDNTDFDSLVPNATLGTGYYRGNNISSMTNRPSPEVNTFPWALDAINVNGYVKQILHVYTAAGNIVVYERIQHYSSGSSPFAAWTKVPTRAEVDALNSKTTQELTSSIASSGSGRATKVGNAVTVQGSFSGITTSGKGWYDICTLPNGFAPSLQVDTVGVDNSASSSSDVPVQLRVTSAGLVRFYSQVAKTTYAPHFCITYVI